MRNGCHARDISAACQLSSQAAKPEPDRLATPLHPARRHPAQRLLHVLPPCRASSRRTAC
jgi:hypothetical protein